MINIGIVGYGNLGRGVKNAILKNEDMKLAAVFSRRMDQIKKELPKVPAFDSNKPDTVTDVPIDIVILCGGSKEDTPVQGPLFAKMFNTVDSFDTHADIPKYFKKMDTIGKKTGHVSIISAGWDPGLFSMERVLGESFLSGSKGYTFWGPGVSQGHSDAARKVKGVVDARQYTIPIEKTLEQVRKGKTLDYTKRQMHKRVVYVVAEKNADQEKIRKEIAEMPNYYSDYDTEVNFISAAEMSKKHSALPHGGFVMTSGETSPKNKEIIEYTLKLNSNPEFTGSVLIACARAAYRLKQSGEKGAFTQLDIPPALYSPHSGATLRSHYM